MSAAELAQLGIKRMRLYMRKIVRAWSRFWFCADHARQIALFRKLFSGLLICIYAARTADVPFFFSDNGILSVAAERELIPRPFAFSLLNWTHSPAAAWSMHAVMLLCLSLIFLGRWVRVSAIIACLLHQTFLHRNLAIAYGMDFISAFYLFYLTLMDSRPSPTRRQRLSEVRLMLSSVAFRMTQIQLCVIYGFSGLRKLCGVRWWQGEAIWDVLANDQITRTDLTWFSHLPALIVAMTYATLAWEIYFPALVWNRKLRYPLLAFGVFLHIGIGVTVNISFFSALMVLSYSLFLDSTHASALAAWVDQFPKKLGLSRKVRTRVADESYV